jgi:hypothetical protein
LANTTYELFQWGVTLLLNLFQLFANQGKLGLPPDAGTTISVATNPFVVVTNNLSSFDVPNIAQSVSSATELKAVDIGQDPFYIGKNH